MTKTMIKDNDSKAILRSVREQLIRMNVRMESYGKRIDGALR